MSSPHPLIETDGAVLVFGGPYSNLQATTAVLAEAARRGIAPERVICTGDLTAYCAHPDETVGLVRDSGIHVVMGNCDEQIGAGAGDCGCGFPTGSACSRLSAAWYAYADAHVASSHRPWLAALPRRIDLIIAGSRLAVIHGGADVINAFRFATSSVAEKRADLDLVAADGIIGGHTGIPFSQTIDGRLWLNAGVIGMPANDGTPRGWYAVLTPKRGRLEIEHAALSYDHAAAARAMAATSLAQEYARTLVTGLWPNCDILPAVETGVQGVPLVPATVVWSKPARPSRNREPAADKLMWPEALETAMRDNTPGSLFRKNVAEANAAGCCAAPTPVGPASACCAPSDSQDAATRALYRDAALNPDDKLCCIANPVWQLPGLVIPQRMHEMNYGCGSTVHPADLAGNPSVLYVGAGAGLELLQFAYFARSPGAVIGLDVVEEMMQAARDNLAEAARLNAWFDPRFVELRKGDALHLPIADASIDVAAQNCLFNIFEPADLQRALAEMGRVLKPGGRLILSDPVCDAAIPARLRADKQLRAMCLTGALPLEKYIARLGEAGFGRIEIRARRPYRVLGPATFQVKKPILVESVEIAAVKVPVPADGPEVLAGETAIYFGADNALVGEGLPMLPANQPVAVAMGEAARLRALKRADVYVSAPTWSHVAARAAASGGCC